MEIYFSSMKSECKAFQKRVSRAEECNVKLRFNRLHSEQIDEHMDTELNRRRGSVSQSERPKEATVT
jgi:hypothetical protein